jgi:hypothetical protein
LISRGGQSSQARSGTAMLVSRDQRKRLGPLGTHTVFLYDKILRPSLTPKTVGVLAGP